MAERKRKLGFSSGGAFGSRVWENGLRQRENQWPWCPPHSNQWQWQETGRRRREVFSWGKNRSPFEQDKTKWGHSRYLNLPKWSKQQLEERLRKKFLVPPKDLNNGGIPVTSEKQSVSICIDSEVWKESVQVLRDRAFFMKWGGDWSAFPRVRN